MTSMCQATTLRGTPCNCKAKNGLDYCGRHKNHFECSICMSSKTTDKTTTKCGHVFCKECIEKWTRDHNTCPICRSQIKEPDTTPTFSIQVPNIPRPPPRDELIEVMIRQVLTEMGYDRLRRFYRTY